ncbi:MAG TPA: hypothetical protein VFM11_03625 [Burkholderiales bacterium]|nr:hypothetical protein [Burkholderiales bacterium]
MAARQQRGQAIIALVLCIAGLASSWLIHAAGPQHAKRVLEQRTFHSLALAKAALIGYAASDANRPGELPCPDANGDGQVRVPDDYRGSRCRTLLGLLPWRTLKLPQLKDGSGAPLWYALSDRFHAGGSKDINSGVEGDLTIRTAAGTSENAVAVLFAPGFPLPNQPRSMAAFGKTGFWKTYCDYLESPTPPTPHCPYSGDPPTEFISGTVGGNDNLLVIRLSDLLPIVEKRLTAELRGSAVPVSGFGLLAYRKRYGHYPSPVDSMGHATTSGALRMDGTEAQDTIALPHEILKAVNRNNWLSVMHYGVVQSDAAGHPKAVRLRIGSTTMLCNAKGLCTSTH